MKTSTPKPPAPQGVLVDATDQNLGRLSTRIAILLRGKHRQGFSPQQLCGDHVIVINAGKLAFHPTKLYRKTYSHHTGYIGHLKTISLGKLFEKDPRQVIIRAVKGMLPKNNLRPEMLKRLHVFADDQHPHEAQKPIALTLTR